MHRSRCALLHKCFNPRPRGRGRPRDYNIVISMIKTDGLRGPFSFWGKMGIYSHNENKKPKKNMGI